MNVNTDRKKNRGFALALAGIAIGAIAQTVLFLSWARSLNIPFPLPGICIYALAGVLLILGMRRLGDSFPSFKVDTNVIPRRKSRFWPQAPVLSRPQPALAAQSIPAALSR